MEDKKEPPDAVWDNGDYSQPDKKSKEELLKEKSQKIYHQLISDDSLMHEVNVLLRQHKIKQLKDK